MLRPKPYDEDPCMRRTIPVTLLPAWGATEAPLAVNSFGFGTIRHREIRVTWRLEGLRPGIPGFAIFGTSAREWVYIFSIAATKREFRLSSAMEEWKWA